MELPAHLNGENYLDFLQATLPGLIAGMGLPQNDLDRIIFMQDGAPPHYSHAVRNHLNVAFPGWMGREGNIY